MSYISICLFGLRILLFVIDFLGNIRVAKILCFIAIYEVIVEYFSSISKGVLLFLLNCSAQTDFLWYYVESMLDYKMI